ncbi:hypothetical protein [Chryseobacterium jejuense]|uniref:Uncharacterized protein n=2 Tax=Chryseobacterium jejuense TaxID=445960 RepID=A0A2X2WSN1_CHRJE|nr:hypothetical protein [Chryseobacterium jejuense]SDJ78640.1 hypothetical protein SAMN05421542_4366 [Chryseobacterium jejuense]SQB43474.1 Uncharacterised protein [Chryseobacterium jejuense]
MIELINTIEINPLKYSKEDFELPEITDYPDPEEYFLKFTETASRLTLNFNEIQKGSNLVNIENIDDESLETIVVAKLTEVEFDDPDERGFVLSFDGGIVLKKDDEVLILPSCCGDLENIENWEKVIDNRSFGWAEIWIGHPWVFYKRENGMISFSDYTEANINDVKDVKTKFDIEESEFKDELDKVIYHQIHFKNRISDILKKMNIDNAERISAFMSGIK